MSVRRDPRDLDALAVCADSLMEQGTGNAAHSFDLVTSPRTSSSTEDRRCEFSPISASKRSAEFLGEPDEKSFGASDVAEPIRVFVPDHFADELRAALAEPGERLVDVVHGEHDA